MIWTTLALVMFSGCARVDQKQSGEANSPAKSATTAVERSSQKEKPAMSDYEPIPSIASSVWLSSLSWAKCRR